MAVTCPNCGERIILRLDRCPKCQTVLPGQPRQDVGRTAPEADNFFGSGRRDRTRDRTDVGDRSAARQETGSLQQELKGETDDTGRNVTRAELDRYAKGPDENVPGAPPQPTPTSYRPTTYYNPYLDKANLPDPRGQYAPRQRTPEQLAPEVQAETAPRNIPQMTAERTGIGSPSTFESMGAGTAGFSTAECVLDGKLPELREADELAFNMLGIEMRSLKSTLCERPNEWSEKLLGDVEISQAMRSSIVQNASADRFVRGVFLPSRGLYINGSAFGDPLGKDRPQVVSTAIHEKLGHGFCNTYTLKGEEETKAGSALFRLASAFGLKQIDEPLYPLWLQKKGVSLRSSFFLEEGFASWVQYRIVQEMARRHPGGGYEEIPTHATTLEALMAALRDAQTEHSATPIAYRSMDDYLAKWLTNEAERMREARALDFEGTRLENVGQVARLAGVAIGMLVADEGARPDRAPTLMMALEAADRLLADAHKTGIQLRYEGGFLIMERISRLFGERCVPAAVRMAGNVRYNLAGVSVDDLMKATSDPNYNCDARLAAMARLGPGNVPRNDGRAFVGMVNKVLGYSLPEGL
jgi:hypothetical protein